MLMKRMMTMMTRAIDEAVELLRDKNLIWSSDLEDIKYELAGLLLASAAQGDIMQTLADNLAKKICCLEETSHIASYDPNLEKR